MRDGWQQVSLASSQSVTPALLRSPHAVGSIGPAFWS
jgi:hypothetical protein